MALDDVRTKGIVSNVEYREKFLKCGLIEAIGRGRGTKYMLAHQYYVHAGKTGKHTKLVGLSREQNKQLILNHLKKNKKGQMKEFADALPELSKKDINNLLQELRRDGKIAFQGRGRTGYWTVN
jgi:ATP-dependent DNA helicase RecG